MSLLLSIRRSAFRPRLLRHYAGNAAASAQALPLCRPRCSSTFCPSNIAELLRPSSLQPVSQPPSITDGQTLKVNGYVRTVRKQKRVAFAAIGDGSTLQTVQAVLTPQLAEGSVECHVDFVLS
jgi:asparaginyl-tRNA synthetase